MKVFFSILFFLMAPLPLAAAQAAGADREFISELDSVKSPFEDGFPKPVVIKKPPSDERRIYSRRVTVDFNPPIAREISYPLPDLELQGVVVGDEIHQAIINGQVVPLHGTISGCRVESVTKEGVEISFHGKKILLKVD